MLNALPPIMASAAPPASVRPELPAADDRERPVLQQPALPAPTTIAGDAAGGRLERLVEAAARELFPGREIAVESFYDKDAGRYVHRIADSRSGELLLQTPPDELLRFFASGREPYGEPLLEIDA